MSVQPTVSNLEGIKDLGSKLARYQEITGKTGAAVLLQKGAQLIHGNRNPKFGAVFDGLVRLFLREAPAQQSITAAARIRGFRLGRREFGGKLSPTAIDRALTRMGGFRSILATVSTDGDGRITLRGVRVGKRGKRILGGRKGRGGYAVPGVAESARQAGDVRLNLRAVATVEEINLREAGRRFLAVGWMFKRWRKLSLADAKASNYTAFRRIENVNPRSRVNLLGDAEMRGDEQKGNVTLRISSYVPGAHSVGDSRGVYSRALAAMSRDLDTYLARKLVEAQAEIFGRKAS